MLELNPIHSSEGDRFRKVADAYWQELMPRAAVIQDDTRREQYFAERFPLDEANRWVYQATVKNELVGFVAALIDPGLKWATVEDFYIVPSERRQGYGGEMVWALYQRFDALGIELIELNVRRDNPTALTFWEAQGFRIAQFQMRQYRGPLQERSFIGALSSEFQK